MTSSDNIILIDSQSSIVVSNTDSDATEPSSLAAPSRQVAGQSSSPPPSALQQQPTQQQPRKGQHLWARHDGSGFIRTGLHRTALMHMIAGRSTSATHVVGPRRYFSGAATTRSQSSCPESIIDISCIDETSPTTEEPSASCSRSTAEAGEAEGDGPPASRPQSNASGVTQYRRRRLILRTINRSWPTSSISSGGSCCGGGGVGVTGVIVGGGEGPRAGGDYKQAQTTTSATTTTANTAATAASSSSSLWISSRNATPVKR